MDDINDDIKVTEDDFKALGYLPKAKVDEYFNSMDEIIKNAMDEPRKFEVAKDKNELNRQLSKVLFGVDTSPDYNERGLVDPQYRPSAFEDPKANRIESTDQESLKANLTKILYGEDGEDK